MTFHANERVPNRGLFLRFIHLDWLKIHLYCAVCHYLYGWEWRFWHTQRPFPMCPCDYHAIGRSTEVALKDVGPFRLSDWLEADKHRREINARIRGKMIEDAYVGEHKHVEVREIKVSSFLTAHDYNFTMDCDFLRVLAVSWVGDYLVLSLLMDRSMSIDFRRPGMPFRAVLDGNIPSGAKYVTSGTRYTADRRFMGNFSLFAL